MASSRTSSTSPSLQSRNRSPRTIGNVHASTRTGGIDAEGAGDDVAPRMGPGLVVGDVAGGDELLDVAVVDRDPAQPSVTQEVGAGVADVDQGEQFGERQPPPRLRRRPRPSPSARPSLITMRAVIVVPMPCWAGLSRAAW